MAVFDLGPVRGEPERPETPPISTRMDPENQSNDLKPVRDDCVISLKVYDSCRQQVCLAKSELGPSRAAECIEIRGNKTAEGEIIVAPSEASSVEIESLRVKNITIMDKTPHPFRSGYWDIRLKYEFQYRLVFTRDDGGDLGSVWAYNIFCKRACLFGSVEQDVVNATDLFKHVTGETSMFDAEPFVLVEARADALSAEINRKRIFVYIGLFTIIKLFRIVQLLVETKGFCIPDKCNETPPTQPCDYFNNLSFPADIFSPPPKPNVAPKE